MTPGEITMAHNGVLLMDEMPEFRRNCLEGLREPLENRMISISRTSGNFEFPADAMIIATANPCPCGNYPDMNRCTCTQVMRSRYMNRLTRPLLERFDLIIPMVKVEEKDFHDQGEESAVIRKRIIYGRNRQKERFDGRSAPFNSQISPEDVEACCQMDEETRTFALQMMMRYEKSMREYHHMLKVARTIADLDGKERVEVAHVLEATRLYNTTMIG